MRGYALRNNGTNRIQDIGGALGSGHGLRLPLWIELNHDGTFGRNSVDCEASATQHWKDLYLNYVEIRKLDSFVGSRFTASHAQYPSPPGPLSPKRGEGENKYRYCVVNTNENLIIRL